MTTGTSGRADGTAQTNLASRGQDARVGRSPLLFYAVGREQLIAVPGEQAAAFMEEARLMEATVEDYLGSIKALDAHQSNYAALMSSEQGMSSNYLSDKQRLEELIRQAQLKVDEKNQALKEVVQPLTDFSSETNKVMELVPIVRQGSRTEYFRLAYARSHIVQAISEEIPLSGGSNVNGIDGSVLTEGKVDWDKLAQQMTAVRSAAKITLDFPWFDDWLKLEKETVELFKWSEEINKNLEARYPRVDGGRHGDEGHQVDLGAEAQLMRWTYGASGLSGEINPLAGKVTVKAGGNAELVLAEAKGTLGYYSPPGGLMLACEVPNNDPLDLGMIRTHTFVSVAGGVGASVAAEVGLNVEMRAGQLRANGIESHMVEFGLPGEQRAVIPRESSHDADTEARNTLAAFAGGQAEATVGAQLEWKSPEEGHRFKPFAKTAPGVAALAGAGGMADFFVRYGNGKFTLSVKAGLCLGIGARGRLNFEVDGSLVLEFAKWVYHQLKNINYRRLFFIENRAFYALSNMIVMSIAFGDELKDSMRQEAADIAEEIGNFFASVSEQSAAAEQRGRLAKAINESPETLRYSTPDAKGAIVYRLMEVNAFDRYHPGNRDLQGWLENPSLFGDMTDRKEAIMSIFRNVQSVSEYENVMQRIKERIDDNKISWRDGEEKVLEFLAAGERRLPTPLSTHYDRELIFLYERLREVASIGTEVVVNDSRAYSSQRAIAWEFRKPCMNTTQCLFDGYSSYA